jgi:modulator of FtsH protease HflC
MYARLSISLAVALIAVLLWRSLFMVDQGTVALLTRFGQPQNAQYGAGAHVKSPFDSVLRFDKRVITHVFPGEGLLSQDQKSLNVDFYVKWRLSDATRYLEATDGDEDVVAARLADVVRERLKSAVAAAPLAAIIGNAQLLSGAASLEALRSQAAALGVEFVDAQLQRIDLPDDVANAVYQRMQQNLVAQGQQLRDQGSAQADKIRDDAEHKRAQILADATREAQRVRGEADANAALAYARAYGVNAEFAAFYRSLEAYKHTLGRDGDILVLSPEGEFFKYLHSASGR